MIGISAKYYYGIYIWLIALISIVVFIRYSRYQRMRLQRGGKKLNIGIGLLTLFLVFFIGLRPVDSVFADMVGYAEIYRRNFGEMFIFDWSTYNILFDNYYLFLSSNRIPLEFFFLSIATIYFAGIAWACSGIFPNDKMAAMLVYLGAFSTFSYGVNGIKAGAAASIFLMAIAMHEKRKKLWAVVCLLLSLSFHHSMVLPIAAFVVCLCVKDSKWFFTFWIFCFLMALLQVSFFQTLFGGLVDEQGSIYFLGSQETVRHDILGGFRIDFIIYSVVPIFFGWLGIRRGKHFSRGYTFLLNLYTMINAIWLLCMYAKFTNRIAYLSWMMLPIVLIYPFLKEDWSRSQYKTFQYVAFGHLAFTLFMIYVYY